jgi:hypothetical protein
MPHDHLSHPSHPSHPSPHRLSVKIYKKIVIIFLGPVLILAGVVLAATFSRATITVTASQVPVNVEAKINIAQKTGTSDTVLGRVLTTTLEDTATVSPKGEGVAKDAPATGTVTLVNNRAAPQTLIPTTRLLTASGVLFRIKARVNIPAGGELKNVAVYADQPGVSGNIPASTFTIPGLPAALQKLVYAASDASMTGGVVTVVGVSADDINGAVSDLKAKLSAKALDSFAEAIRQSGYDGIVSRVDEVSEQASAKVGDAVGSFTVHCKVTVIAVAYDRAKFDAVAQRMIAEAVPADMELKSSNVAIVAPTVQNADATSGAATLVAELAGTATLAANNGILSKDRLAGLDASSAVGYLKSFGAVSDAKVTLWPFWVRKIPSLKSHIEIKVE